MFVGDPYFNIASFSIDRHFLLKQKLPKTNLFNQQNKQTLSNPALVATSNEEYIYYLTPTTSFIFHYINIASDMYSVINTENNFNFKATHQPYPKQYSKMDIYYCVDFQESLFTESKKIGHSSWYKKYKQLQEIYQLIWN